MTDQLNEAGIEAAAEAICELNGYEVEALKAGRYEGDAQSWGDYLSDARAAITAYLAATGGGDARAERGGNGSGAMIAAVTLPAPPMKGEKP